MSHEIIKQFNETYNFWQLTCSEGHKITSWNEGDDIKDYASFEIAYCPKDADFSIYHCVTAEEDAKYLEAHEKAIKKDREKRHKEQEQEQLSTIEVE